MGSSAQAQSIDLASYSLVGTYALPIQAPGLTIQYEASAVTWNRSTNTLFIIGDGGRYVQQTSLTGVPIDFMALPTTTNPSRAGVEFDDPEGLVWIGGNTFVMTEERKRNAVRFNYVAGSTLSRADTATVTLGTPVGNTGLEGITFDPSSNSYILVNQAAGSSASQNIFQTSITFSGTGGSATAFGTATAINASTVNAPSLFPPANIGFADLNDVFALSNVAAFAGAASDNLLVLTNAGGLKEMTRTGVVVSQRSIPSGTSQIEGVTMDDRGYIYLVSDNGDFGNSQIASSLFVYAPVPEPGSYALLLTGLAFVAGVARRRAREA